VLSGAGSREGLRPSELGLRNRQRLLARFVTGGRPDRTGPTGTQTGRSRVRKDTVKRSSRDGRAPVRCTVCVLPRVIIQTASAGSTARRPPSAPTRRRRSRRTCAADVWDDVRISDRPGPASMPAARAVRAGGCDVASRRRRERRAGRCIISVCRKLDRGAQTPGPCGGDAVSGATRGPNSRPAAYFLPMPPVTRTRRRVRPSPAGPRAATTASDPAAAHVAPAADKAGELKRLRRHTGLDLGTGPSAWRPSRRGRGSARGARELARPERKLPALASRRTVTDTAPLGSAVVWNHLHPR
jgi:hypothetical protein